MRATFKSLPEDPIVLRAVSELMAAITFNRASFPTCYGPEYISGKLLIWAEKHGVSIQHIQPGKPQQNAYIEEAQDHATQWLWTYNNDRPNMGIGGVTPAQKLKMAA